MVRCIWFFGSLFDDSSGSFHYCDHPYSGAVLPVQRSYINARERLRLRWTKKKKKQKPTKREMLIDGQQSAYLPWISSWFLTDIHRAMGIFWFGVLRFAQNHSASTILQKQNKKSKKKKSIQVLGILPKKHSVSSSVHAAHCALKEQLYECLCDAALQHPLHRAWSQPAVPPWARSSPRSLLSRARCPPCCKLLGSGGGQTPPWGPSAGCICIPHPASRILHPSGRRGRQSGEGFCWPILKARLWCRFEPNPADI